MTDFEKVIDFNNMYRAFRKAKCGKGYKKSSARFNLAALDGVNTLISQLKNKTYKVSNYTEFKVYEPKERIIQTSSFKDKVVQHSLCDNVIMPKLQRVFIYDNCAAQKARELCSAWIGFEIRCRSSTESTAFPAISSNAI